MKHCKRFFETMRCNTKQQHTAIHCQCFPGTLAMYAYANISFFALNFPIAASGEHSIGPLRIRVLTLTSRERVNGNPPPFENRTLNLVLFLRRELLLAAEHVSVFGLENMRVFRTVTRVRVWVYECAYSHARAHTTDTHRHTQSQYVYTCVLSIAHMEINISTNIYSKFPITSKIRTNECVYAHARFCMHIYNISAYIGVYVVVCIHINTHTHTYTE